MTNGSLIQIRRAGFRVAGKGRGGWPKVAAA
jgi:hypothetical protein